MIHLTLLEDRLLFQIQLNLKILFHVLLCVFSNLHLGQDLEFQTVTPTGKLDWFRVKLSLLV